MTTLDLDRSIFTIIVPGMGDALETQPVLLSLKREELAEEVAIYTESGKLVGFILESNPVEGWCRDITQDVMEEIAEGRNYEDDNREHRISNFEAGTGRHGPFGG